jgi:hypothetical protein
MNDTESSTLIVLTTDGVAQVRGIGDQLYRHVPLQAEELAVNINLFLGKLGSVLEETPEKVGDFQLTEISVSAEITGEGKVVLCGVGGEVGISGGLKFVFKRKEA